MAAAYSFASDGAKERAETVAARPPYSGYVFIDSKQRRPGERISNITVRDSVFETNYVSEVIPASFKMFWAVPNITPRNNGLRVQISGGVETTHFIAPGFYNAAKLADAINAQFAGIIEVEAEDSIPGQVNLLRISSTLGPVRLLHPAGASGSVLDAIGLAPMATFVNTMGILNPIIAVGCPLPYTRYFDVVADQLHADSILRDEVSNRSHSSVLFRVWINKAEPHALEHDPRTVKAIKVSPDRILSFLGVRLVDEYGEELYTLPENGHDYSIRLVVIGGQPRQP